MDTSNFMAIEMVIFAVVALGLAFRELWSLRDHKSGDRSKKERDE